MMKFSVAITTYNRPQHVLKLVQQIRVCSLTPDCILVIDSSDRVNKEVINEPKVRYIRSSHKNQPYQRYLAYLSCDTEVIIFLDDDLEIIDNTVFEVMVDRLKKPGIRGVSVGFDHHHVISDIIGSGVNSK